MEMSEREHRQRNETAMREKWRKISKPRVFVKRVPPIPSSPNMLASEFGKLSSVEICEAFAAVGLNADWFASKMLSLLEKPDTSTHAAIRLMTLMSKILAQAEGDKLTVQGPTDRGQKEIEAEIITIESKLAEMVRGKHQLANQEAGDTPG